MLDHFHTPTPFGNADVFYFEGTGTAAGQVWQTWSKPRGKSMIHILLVGKGGNGGTGAIGAAGSAAGGGGGGSGGQTAVTMPLAMIPDNLYITLAGWSATTTLASYVTIAPRLTAGAGAPAANDTLAIANGGANGGNASGATAGTAGGAGAIATAATMPLGWMFATALAGQAGTAGGAGAIGVALTLPTTGLLVTGGCGGGGLGAASAFNGGAITGAGVFPAQPGGSQGVTSTTRPEDGLGGYRPIPGLLFGYGGTGGGTTHLTPNGAAAAQSTGGHGAPGCGGGGSGGAFTGSTAGGTGMGGPAFCVITVW